jgi:NTE family protein
VGQRLDPTAVQQQQELLYGHGFLELLDYRLQQDASGDYGLDVAALRNSWGPNYLRVGVQLQDDFKGNTVFNAAGRVDFTELNSLGAESVWDAQVGTAPLLATEFFQPLSIVTQYFVAPMLQVEAHDIPQVAGGQQVGKFREHSFEYGLSGGRELDNWGEIRIGAQNVIGDEYVSQGFSAPSTSFNVTQFFARFGFDTLDNANFPRTGQALVTQVTLESNSAGQQGSDLYTLDWRVAHSWAKNTLGLWLTAGSTVGGSTTNVHDYFPLGGFLNLSGVETNTLAGPQMAIGRLIYLRKIGSGGEGILDVPAYLGASFEMGNVWSERSQVTFGSARKDGSVFFGADTYIGPAYLAVGYDQSGSVALYVFVGRAF